MSDDVEETEFSIYPEWKQAAIDAVKEFTYGDTITHEWLLEKFDMKKQKTWTEEEHNSFQLKLLSYVDGFKDHMLENNKMYLTNARGIGYLIVSPEEQTGRVWKKMTKGVRRELLRANAGLTNILLEALSDEARLENTNKQTVLAALRSANARMLKSPTNKETDDGTV